MIIQLNPLKWFAGQPKVKALQDVPATVPAVSEIAVQNAAAIEESAMANGFVSFLKAVGRLFEKGLVFAVKDAVPIEKLVALLFPPAAAAVKEAGDAAALIQNAVILVEQKYAASGVQGGRGADKLAEVLTLTEQAVTSLLAKAGIQADTTYIQNIINAVVAILNVQAAPNVTA